MTGLIYREWRISFACPPIPDRSHDWLAYHPEYDGSIDAEDNRVLNAPSLSKLKAEIDNYIDRLEEQ